MNVKQALQTTTILFVAIFSPLGLAQTSAATATVIDIKTVPSEFTPNRIVLHAGQATTLRFTPTEGMHGIESRDLGIPQTMLKDGETTAVTITPTKTGTYAIHCEVPCGPNHPDMTLTVVVE